MTDYLICVDPKLAYRLGKSEKTTHTAFVYRWVGGTETWYRVPGGLRNQTFDTLDQGAMSYFEPSSKIGRSVVKDERFPYELFTGLTEEDIPF